MSEIKYKDLAWTEGNVNIVGIKREVYFLPRRDIALWPTRPTTITTAMGELVTYVGDFTLVALAKWKKLTVIMEKSPVDGKSQGTKPSKTFINSVVLQHESVNEDASALAMQANNDELVWLIPTKSGKFRVIGNDIWNSDTSVDQKLGAAVTDESSTTITTTVTDVAPGMFYTGEIDAEAGIINPTAP